MKKTLLIFALFFTHQSSQAQGNLQFNKTIFMTLKSTDNYSSNNGTAKSFATFTVPESKIWKVRFRGYYVFDVENGNFMSYTDILLSKSGQPPIAVTSRDGENYIPSSVEFYLDSGTWNLLSSTWGTQQVVTNINGIEYNIITE